MGPPRLEAAVPPSRCESGLRRSAGERRSVREGRLPGPEGDRIAADDQASIAPGAPRQVVGNRPGRAVAGGQQGRRTVILDDPTPGESGSRHGLSNRPDAVESVVATGLGEPFSRLVARE
jgi:hypothetical protein